MARKLFWSSAAVGALIVLLVAVNPWSTPRPGKAEELKSAPEAQVKTAEAAKEVKPPEKSVKLQPGMGAVEGKIVLKGAVPAIEAIVVPTSNKDHAACNATVKSERLVLSAKKEIRDVVVSIANYTPKNKPKPQTVKLDNKGCTFIPHVLAATKGSTLQVTNSDKFLHNTHGLLGNTFNNAVIAGGSPMKKKLRRPGWTPITCDIHPWMKANLHVFEHELFDVSNSSGDYNIVNIPPGVYEVEVWHEKVAFSFQPPRIIVGKVTVEAGKTARLDFELEAPAPKPAPASSGK